MGRNKKFELGDIAYRRASQSFVVVVGYETTDQGSRYRVIPLDYKKRRRGDAIWLASWLLDTTDESSGTASVKTYRANEALVERGCSCECCVHEAYSLSEWTNHGKWRDSEPIVFPEDKYL